VNSNSLAKSGCTTDSSPTVSAPAWNAAATTSAPAPASQ
jgi:hypothetical protein